MAGAQLLMDALDREFNKMCDVEAGYGFTEWLPATQAALAAGTQAGTASATPSRAEYEAFLATRQLQQAPCRAHPADIVEAARRDQEFRFQMMKLQAQEAERRRAAGLFP
jgi:hypothetical protein